MEDKSMKKKKWPMIVAAIIVIIVIAAVAGGKDDEPKKVSSDGQVQETGKTESTETQSQKFAVGDTPELKSVKVTLVSVTESEGSMFTKPADGNVLVGCEFEISNESDKDIDVSSVMSFEAYCDSYSVNQSLTGLTEFTQNGKNQLDGSVAAGKKMNGVIAYEVPADWQELEISYSPSFWGKAMTFVAQHD